MTTNIAQALFKSTGSTTSRSLGGRAADVINVKDYGATGDGSTNDTTAIQAALDAAFGSSSSPHGQSAQLNKAVYFPAGIYKVLGNPALIVTGVRGGLIFGDGMSSSTIRGGSNASVTFRLNGFGFSTMRDLAIECNGSGANVALDYDWDNSAPQSSQNSSFINCAFYGQTGSKNSSAIACRIGNSGFQSDTATFLNCFFANAGHGLEPKNANAIGNTVIGGQFLQNDYGIYVAVGGVETIHGAFFAQNATYSISISGAAFNAYSIAGCRVEDIHFLNAVPSQAGIFHVHGIDHATTGLGHFVTVGAPVHIDGCWSIYGDVSMGSGGSTIGNVTISNSVFNRFDALGTGGSSAATTTFLKNTYIGDIRTGLGRYIVDQKIVRGITRTLNVEATALSDLQVLYDNYNGVVAQNNFINTSPTAAGVSPTFSVASPTVVNIGQPHNYQGGEPVAFSLVSAGSMPTGITSARTYFVTLDSLVNGVSGQQTFHLSLTQANALAGTANVNVSGAGSGNINTWAVRPWAVGDIILKSNVAALGSPGWICTTAGWGSTVNAGETQAVFGTLPVIT